MKESICVRPIMAYLFEPTDLQEILATLLYFSRWTCMESSIFSELEEDTSLFKYKFSLFCFKVQKFDDVISSNELKNEIYCNFEKFRKSLKSSR